MREDAVDEVRVDQVGLNPRYSRVYIGNQPLQFLLSLDRSVR